MVLLILALGGLAAYILLKPEQQPQVIVKEVPGAAPSVADDKDKKDDDDDDDDKDEDKDKKDEDEKDEDEKPEGEEAAADADAGAAGSSKSGGKKSGGKKTGGKKSGSTKKPASSDPLAGFGDPPPKSSSSSKKPAGKKKEDVSVDCILDPAKCNKGGSKKSSSSSSSSKPADPNLPATLTSSDIRAGVAPYKGAAKACGSKHGAAAGTKVKVKLSISGATGTVSSASAQAPHQGTPLGNCVAATVKKSKFKKFQKSTLGAVYPFTM